MGHRVSWIQRVSCGRRLPRRPPKRPLSLYGVSKLVGSAVLADRLGVVLAAVYITPKAVLGVGVARHDRRDQRPQCIGCNLTDR